MFEPCDVLECQGHFDGIVPSLACILTKHNGVCSGKHLLKSLGNAISESLIIKMSLDASALKNLCLGYEFQSCLLFIMSLLFSNFLTALKQPSHLSHLITVVILGTPVLVLILFNTVIPVTLVNVLIPVLLVILLILVMQVIPAILVIPLIIIIPVTPIIPVILSS